MRNLYMDPIKHLLLCGLLLASMTACGDAPTQQEEANAQARPLKVGVLVCMTEDTPFFVTLLKGAKAEAERLDVTILDRYANDNSTLQSAQLRELLKSGVDAILINPVDETIGPAVADANRSGVPLFTFDRSTGTGIIVSHIASDNVIGGEMAGMYITQYLKGKGLVVELAGTENSSAAFDRSTGFNWAMDKADGLKVVARERADFNRTKGKEVFRRILEQQPRIDAVFAHNDDMVLGAIEAAREVGRDKEIMFVGFDAVDAAIKALQTGDLDATVAQQPAEIGRLSIQTVTKHINGETVPEFIPVDLALITR